MKVALFVHCFFPNHFYGTEAYTLELARNLRLLGHQPVVVTAVFPGEPRQTEIVTRYEYEHIPVYCIDKNFHPHTRVKDTYYQPVIREILQQVLTEIRPDLVHVTHLINHTAVLLEVCDKLNTPAIATYTDFFGFCFNNKLEGADGRLCRGPNRQRTNCLRCFMKASSEQTAASSLRQWAAKYPWSLLSSNALNVLRRVPGFRRGRLAGLVLDITCRPDILGACYRSYRAAIAPTTFLRTAYVANGFTMPIHEIRFGIDLPRLQKPAKNGNEVLKIGYIGQIAPHKGTDLLVDAFCRLRARNAELHVYGPADQDPAYMDALRRRAQGSTVFFRGTFPKDKMAEVFSELDFLAIPSRWYENSPLVLLNALASHTPVIISNVAGMTEFVEHGRNGFIFRRGEAADLQRTLAGITENPERSRQMTRETEYSRTTMQMTRETVAVYDSAVRSSGTSGTAA